MKRLSILLAAAMLFTALVGCTTQNEDDTDAMRSPSQIPAATSTPLPDQPLTLPPDSVFTPQPAGAPDIVHAAAKWAQDRQDDLNDIGVFPDIGDFSFMFSEANAAYRSEEFTLAKGLYEDILAMCPAHHGAINNLALTLMQLGEYESALQYCVLNRSANPSFYAGWVNLLIAGHALGFRPSELFSILEEEYDNDFPGIFEYAEAMERDFPEQNLMSNVVMMAYLYNLLYADMEYVPELTTEESERLAMQYVTGEMTELEYNQKMLEMYMDMLGKSLDSLTEDNPEDSDAQLLLEYFNALYMLRERQLETESSAY